MSEWSIEFNFLLNCPSVGIFFAFYAAVRKSFCHGVSKLVVLVHFKNFERDSLSCLFPSIVTSISTFSVFGFFTSMPVSKASLVFTQTKTPYQSFFKNPYKFIINW